MSCPSADGRRLELPSHDQTAPERLVDGLDQELGSDRAFGDDVNQRSHRRGLSESRRDSLGDDEVPFIDEMIDVLLAHLAQFRDQRRDRFRTSTTRAARVLEAIGLPVVHSAIKSHTRYTHDQPVGRVEFLRTVFSIQPSEGLLSGCSKPLEQGRQTFVLDRQAQGHSEVHIPVPGVPICTGRKSHVEELALGEQPTSTITCVVTKKERNKLEVLHLRVVDFIQARSLIEAAL